MHVHTEDDDVTAYVLYAIMYILSFQKLEAGVDRIPRALAHTFVQK